MPDGVLHERLEEQRRNPRAEQLRVIPRSRTSSAEPKRACMIATYFSTVTSSSPRVISCSRGAVSAWRSRSERCPIIASAAAGSSYIVRRDGVQRVEKKVRLELVSQRRELGLSELALQTELTQLADTRGLNGGDEREHREHRRVRDHVLRRLVRDVQQGERIAATRREDRKEYRARRRDHRRVRERERHEDHRVQPPLAPPLGDASPETRA